MEQPPLLIQVAVVAVEHHTLQQLQHPAVTAQTD
jgi:hypothetical protein